MYYTTKLRTSHRKPSAWLSHTFENTYTVSYFSARTHWPAISNSVQFLPYRAVHIGTHTNIHTGLKSKVLGKCLTVLTWAKRLHLLLNQVDISLYQLSPLLHQFPGSLRPHAYRGEGSTAGQTAWMRIKVLLARTWTEHEYSKRVRPHFKHTIRGCIGINTRQESDLDLG